MAEGDLIKVVLWLKSSELATPQRLLVREGREDVSMLVLAEYLTAAIVREG